ncbi:MAG: hypothetical protein KKF48_04745 [Nanoarchaeota archaeon]|nr:hypothetical protein [Nanoarchaeota archaeon]MBU1028325.1 hypothetical protein [Nanoarchaeota archaeon]
MKRSTRYILQKKKELDGLVTGVSDKKAIASMLNHLLRPFSKLDRMCLVAPFSDVDWANKYVNVFIPASKVFLYGTLAYKILS